MNLYPRLHCPRCASALQRRPVQLHLGHKVLLGFIDVPFWLVFGVGLAVGLSNPVAGVAAAGILALGIWLWVRVKSGYHCEPCATTFRYADVVGFGASHGPHGSRGTDPPK